MRKRKAISAVVAAACVLMFSATAFAAVSVSANPTTPVTGQTITFTVTGTMDGVSADISTSGLEIVSVSGGLSDASSVLLLADYGGLTATYVYRVTAPDGGNVSFQLTSVTESSGGQDFDAPNTGWSGTAVGSEPTPTPTPPASQEPTSTPTPSDSASPSGEPSPSTNPTTPPPSDSASPSGGNGSATNTPQPSGSTPPDGSSGGAGTTGGTGGTTGGTGGGTNADGTVTRLPRTADSTTNMWTFALLAAAVGIVAIVAARKCALPVHHKQS